MNRRKIAIRLSIIVALSGLLPIAGVGAISIEILRGRLERSSQEALRVVAQQAAYRIQAYLDQQQTLVRAMAAALSGTKDIDARLQAVPLDAPSISRIDLVEGVNSPLRPSRIQPEDFAQVLRGTPKKSDWYLGPDQVPAMDVCLPMPDQAGRAVCATLDMLELWRLVQRVRVGESGYALAFDSKGRLLAAGEGRMRPFVLRGGSVAESPTAVAAVGNLERAPGRYIGGTGEEVLAGWALLPDVSWSVVVEQPVREALRGARTAQFTLAAVAIAALLLSILVGVVASLPVLTSLEVEERWRTAGRIATGITHDMGHRLAILQQTAALAETGDASFLPLIRDNLRNEVATLKKFVGDFADLSREVRTADLLPLELNAFVESLRRTASPHAEKGSVTLLIDPPGGELWVRADRYLLERAALNIVYNAVEASPRGATVHLSCRTRESSRGAQEAVLVVTDQGAGIDSERLPRIFDAFRSTKRTGAHVGMGLPNVHRIITAHGGNVAVESEVGKGSTFTLSLPVTRPDEQPNAMGFPQAKKA